MKGEVWFAQRIVRKRIKLNNNFGRTGNDVDVSLNLRRTIHFSEAGCKTRHVVADLEDPVFGFKGRFQNRRVISVTLAVLMVSTPEILKWPPFSASTMRPNKEGESRKVSTTNQYCRRS